MFLWVSGFASCFGSFSLTQDVNLYVIPIADGDPTLLGQFLDCVLVHYQHFCGFREVDSPACKLQFNCLPRLNVCNDLTEAMKALDGKKGYGNAKAEADWPAMTTRRESGGHRLSVRQERDGGEGDKGQGHSALYGALYHLKFFPFFSVQCLHGFRQVVQLEHCII